MNAASLHRFERAAQATREALHPHRVSIDGGPEIAAAVTFEEYGEQLEDGGIASRSGCSLSIRKSMLPVPPDVGAEVEITSGEGAGIYYVRGVLGEGDTVSWLIRCGTGDRY